MVALDERVGVFLVRLSLLQLSVPSCESSDLGVYLVDWLFSTAAGRVCPDI